MQTPERTYDRLVDLASMIDVRPGVRSGKPCFVGTRIAVYDILEYLASGMTAEEVVADFPELTAEMRTVRLRTAAATSCTDAIVLTSVPMPADPASVGGD